MRPEPSHARTPIGRRHPRARFRDLFLVAIVLAHVGVSHGAPSTQERQKKIQAMETNVSPEALQRKQRSESLLRTEGVPVNEFLPVIETAQEATRRTRDEVALRALALLVVAVKGEGLEQPVVERVVAEYGLAKHFTPKEKAFIANPAPSQHDRVQFTWRYEAAWVLLWALGYIDRLDKPTAICDVPRAVTVMRERSARKFVADARLRPQAEILDQADRIYRYRWAVVDAQVKGEGAPASLNPGVAMERHHALNWLIGYMDQDWDDISLDT